MGKSGDADVVGLTLRGFDVVSAICFDIAHGDKVLEVVCIRLNPGTGQELDGVSWVKEGVHGRGKP